MSPSLFLILLSRPSFSFVSLPRLFFVVVGDLCGWFFSFVAARSAGGTARFEADELWRAEAIPRGSPLFLRTPEGRTGSRLAAALRRGLLGGTPESEEEDTKPPPPRGLRAAHESHPQLVPELGDHRGPPSLRIGKRRSLLPDPERRARTGVSFLITNCFELSAIRSARSDRSSVFARWRGGPARVDPLVSPPSFRCGVRGISAVSTRLLL